LLAAGKRIIGERGVGADEYVVLDANAVPQMDAGLDRDPIADQDIAFDEGVGADVGIRSDLGAFENIGECPDSGSLPDLTALAQGLWMYEVISQFFFLYAFPWNRSLRITIELGRCLVFSNARQM
jgi:hypothetical protein